MIKITLVPLVLLPILALWIAAPLIAAEDKPFEGFKSLEEAEKDGFACNFVKGFTAIAHLESDICISNIKCSKGTKVTGFVVPCKPNKDGSCPAKDECLERSGKPETRAYSRPGFLDKKDDGDSPKGFSCSYLKPIPKAAIVPRGVHFLKKNGAMEIICATPLQCEGNKYPRNIIFAICDAVDLEEIEIKFTEDGKEKTEKVDRAVLQLAMP